MTGVRRLGVFCAPDSGGFSSKAKARKQSNILPKGHSVMISSSSVYTLACATGTNRISASQVLYRSLDTALDAVRPAENLNSFEARQNLHIGD